MMTYEEKVRWLRRYQDSLRKEQELAEEVEQLRSRACKVTPSLSGMPGGTSDGQALPRAVEELLEIQRELYIQITQSEIVRREIIDSINHIENQNCYEILRRRYLLGETWETIRNVMHYSLRNVYFIHRKAIEKISIL